MKLWKSATFAFMLCGAALSILLVRNMATLGRLKPKTKHLHASSSSSRRSSSSESASEDSFSSLGAAPAESTVLSQQMRGLPRRARSTDNINSFLSEFSTMFQSFTEGELQHVVRTLLDRKQRRSRRLGGNQARRTKRARRQNLCSLRKVELTVSELGLGYDSDETLLLHYCSGTCTAHRHNYDISMKNIKGTVFKRKGLNDKVSNGPCCRPTAFEKEFSFLDNNSRYQMLQNVSAKNCGCV